ncbi:MAG: hypothetical protein OXI24_05400 [Candidatus Poribacteria bacterium]|nr:hypothetical protein [Candidatus Poribacteria bacterium]
MEFSDLLSGIAVVIDNEVNAPPASGDRITEIVERFEQDLNLPVYKSAKMPRRETWHSLLQSASFVVLDWQLWPDVPASQLEEKGIVDNRQFVETARDYFVPVFIFTNLAPKTVEDKLGDLCKKGAPVFVGSKTKILESDKLNISVIEDWINENASVYVLKTWEYAFHAAKRELFSSMYKKSHHWPKTFWKAYSEDGVDASSSLMHLVNSNLQGRMRTSVFDNAVLHTAPAGDSQQDIREIIAEVSFRGQENLPDDEIRCGDLFEYQEPGKSNKKYLLNIRPDCDCIPRNGQKIEKVELYCIVGKEVSDTKVGDLLHQGHLMEKVWQSIAFAIYNGKSLEFDFRKLEICTFDNLKDKRIGRWMHPYVTRTQQRFALYLHRHGLPRIPNEAIGMDPNVLTGTGIPSQPDSK